MFQVASAWGPELAQQEPASAGWRQRVMLSQLVIQQVWGKHSFNKSQLAAYLTHVNCAYADESVHNEDTMSCALWTLTHSKHNLC